jgi:hypothetical protein
MVGRWLVDTGSHGRQSIRMSEESSMSRPAKPAERPTEERRERSIDNLLQRWSCGVVRQGLDGAIAGASALLRGAQELRRMQLEAGHQAEQAHADAAARIRQARASADFGAAQLALATATAEGMLRYLAALGDISTRTAAAVGNEWLEASTRIGREATSFAAFALQVAAEPKSVDRIEAQAEHVLNPLGATFFGWPAQEASREWMSAAWSWSGLGDAAEAEKNAPTLH